MVPPVPTPATIMLTLPSVSRQISSAVVECAAGFAGFANCCGMKEFLIFSYAAPEFYDIITFMLKKYNHTVSIIPGEPVKINTEIAEFRRTGADGQERYGA